MATPMNNHLASVRGSRGLVVADLARRVGVNRQTIYAIEAGSYMPNTEVALKLARELQVSVEELFQLAAPAADGGMDSIRTEYLSTRKPEPGQAVRSCKVGSHWVSAPVSAVPYHMPEADGIVTAARRAEGRPEIQMFSQEAAGLKRLVLAGCDPAASLLAHMAERIEGIEVVHAPASSQLALSWLQEGKVHVAGSHLEDSRTGEFNVPFIRRQFAEQDMVVVTFAEWEAGFVVGNGNPKAINKIEDLARKDVRIVNRENGSGSRALLDKSLRAAGIPGDGIRGYDRVAAGHLAAAYTVFSGDADCCLATQAASRAFRLNFIPLHRERYDFALHRKTLELPQAQAFLDVLQRASLRRKLETFAGYDTAKTGAVLD